MGLCPIAARHLTREAIFNKQEGYRKPLPELNKH